MKLERLIGAIPFFEIKDEEIGDLKNRLNEFKQKLLNFTYRNENVNKIPIIESDALKNIYNEYQNILREIENYNGPWPDYIKEALTLTLTLNMDAFIIHNILKLNKNQLKEYKLIRKKEISESPGSFYKLVKLEKGILESKIDKLNINKTYNKVNTILKELNSEVRFFGIIKLEEVSKKINEIGIPPYARLAYINNL